eukprot:TRINITY_DN4401_c0_g1_i3.p1 TRINITY_DN4401_c0_g1~~TRINITY_DN4401_c0_g1_i3.p1  ORF type:complete len:626 (-),score=83.03 TRINITY_DN4401_c0_g1_i3:1478-3283(-)
MSQDIRDPLQYTDEEEAVNSSQELPETPVVTDQPKQNDSNQSQPPPNPSTPKVVETPQQYKMPDPEPSEPQYPEGGPLSEGGPLADPPPPSPRPLYPEVSATEAPPLYPEVTTFENKFPSMRRTYDRQDTMYSAMMSEDASDMMSAERRDSDLADYPEGPAVSLAESHVHILVSDPMKMVGQSVLPGVNDPYMTYLVTTRCSLSSYMPEQTAVRRRFKDFVALGNLLRNTHRGYFIPPRPEKNVVQGRRMDARFVEYRRRALERYLNVLGVHSVIGKSDVFKQFLSLEGDLRTNPRWQKLYPPATNWVDGVAKLLRQMIGQEKPIPDPLEATQTARKTHDLVRMVKEGLHLYQNRQQGGGQYGGEELQLRSDRTLIEEGKKQLTETVKRSEQYMRRLKRFFNIHGSLGIILSEMGKYEEEVKYTSGQGTRLVGETCVKYYKSGSKAQEESKHQLQLFYHYKHFMPAVLEGLAAREGCLLTLQTLEAEIVNKKNKVEELQSPSSIPYDTRQRKLVNLQSDLDALKAATESANAEYERIKLHNQQDMTQLRKQKEREFLDMLTKFTEIQVGCWGSAAQMWKRVAMDLGATEEDFAPKSSTRRI